MERTYNYRMGIKVGSTAIPDPSSWKYQVGDLDTSGRRDARGKLHRAYVATKVNYEFSWNAIGWDEMQVILEAVNHPKFKLTAPDVTTFRGQYTGNYYVGDRTGGAKYFLAGENIQDGKYMPVEGLDPKIAQYDLKLKFIEY